MFFPKPANHIRFSFVEIEPRMDPPHFPLKINNSSWKNSNLDFQVCVFYVIWEIQFTKIIVAMLLYLEVLYPEVYLNHWVGMGAQILSPNLLNQSL